MTYHQKQSESWSDRKQRERGERAVERQLDYQENKARSMTGDTRMAALTIKARALKIRQKLESFGKINEIAKVVEVGSGAHGLIFGFEDVVAIGIDPLAVDYKRLFPVWQNNAQTVAAVGEELPFDDESFDVVLSDNVVDHAADPVGIIFELTRILKPGGIMYFSVNTHHPIYQQMSVLHGFWNNAGIKFEIGPFADHTVHFTEKRVDSIFDELPVEILSKSLPYKRTSATTVRAKGIEGQIKRMFHKNILYEVIAKKPSR